MILSYIYQSGYEFVFGIRTHKGHEDGSNLDPDPHHTDRKFTLYITETRQLRMYTSTITMSTNQ